MATFDPNPNNFTLAVFEADAVASLAKDQGNYVLEQMAVTLSLIAKGLVNLQADVDQVKAALESGGD